jgi:hypothetical protein
MFWTWAQPYCWGPRSAEAPVEPAQPHTLLVTAQLHPADVVAHDEEDPLLEG